ncbi:MAG: hypothetical protein DELT_01661 [Desulfovibrio sp.]
MSGKSRGAGTVFLLIIVFLGVAGGSAWFIHSILNGDDVAVSQPTAGSSTEPGSASGSIQDGDVPPPPSVLAPLPPATGVPGTTGPDGQGAGQAAGSAQTGDGAGTGAQTLSGGVTVESIPGGTADTAPGSAMAPPVIGDSVGDSHASQTGAEPDSASQATQTDPLLVVPGASSGVSSGASPGVSSGASSAASQGQGGDAVVRPAFVDDIALFLAENYWPKGTHPSAGTGGSTTVSLRWANLRYGAELRGAGGSTAARAAVLQYVLNPATVSKLYGMYADPFVSSLSRAAETRSVSGRLLTDAERKEMLTIYASYAARVANALERYAATPGMAAKVETYSQAESVVAEANKAYLESVALFESSSEGADANAITVARLKRDKEAATYQKRIREREAARRDLVAAMSPGGKAVTSGGDTLVYVAFWAYRRGADSAPGLRACAKALTDISGKLTAAAKSL